MAFADLLEQVGGMGLFQIINIFLLCIPYLFFSCNNLLQNFVAVIPAHHCQLPPMDNINTSWAAGWDPVKQMEAFIPLDRNHQPEQCLQYTRAHWWLLESNFTATNTTEMDTEPCKDGWTYDRSKFGSTIVSEWDLVCDQTNMRQMVQFVYMTGMLVGGVIFGRLSDRFGRRIFLIWCHFYTAVIGVCAAFSTKFVWYCVFCFLQGLILSVIGMNVPCLLVEWIPTRKRAVVGTLIGHFFSIGQILLAGLAYAIRDWRWLQLTVSLPYFIFFCYSWWLPESVRWLILAKKPEEAVKMLKKVAKINRKHEAEEMLTTENVNCSMQKELDANETTHSIFDLVRTSAIRHISFCTSFAWFSTSFCYYGLFLDLQNFGIDIYMMQIIFGVIDIPAKLITTASLCYFGRHRTLSTSSFLASLVILADIFVPKDMKILRISLAVFGKGCIASCFSSITLFSSELYPTTIRQTGLSLGHTMARMGAALSPIMKMTSVYMSSLPFIIYGAAALLGALFSYCLPETKDQPLPETIQEVEIRSSRSKRKWLCDIHNTNEVQENVDSPMFKTDC
ncbi:solute carrier family 22 member 6-A [Microcaecilia unicolor]|uniref:Solute carrier family 22 member 6-A-like n=1 Tax=Microcaecilia unicolor TaxID=1415580 RepID=A0A6P7ZGR1_9AMPH|nr:solute carrier family 22 member 6-A-like [Microcaecilia unicolor]